MNFFLGKTRIARLVTLLTALILLGALDAAGARASGPIARPAPSQNLLPRLIADGQFVYGHNMAGFDLEAYLQKQAPHLVSHYYDLNAASMGQSISPKVILTLIEMRSELVTNGHATTSQLEDPFLRAETGWVNQLIAISNAMTDKFYDHYYNVSPLVLKDRPSLSVRLKDGQNVELDPAIQAGSYAVAALLGGMLSHDEFLDAIDNSSKHSFYQTYQRLFPNDNPLDESNKLPQINNVEASLALPTLQLPWPTGEAWKFNSVHSPNGSTATLASIDFSRTFPAPGSNTSGDWVRPAAPGKVKPTGPSANPYCQIAIWHTSDGATRTTYFHLTNAQVRSDQDVTTSTNLANPASTYQQAITTCWSGMWTNPHLHFTLVYQGVYWPLNGIQLSGWTIHSGSSSYDCNTWFERNRERKNNWCNGSGGDPVPNSSVNTTLPAAPSNLRATAISSSQIRLEWNDNSNNETSFEIYDGDRFVASVGANTTSYTSGGLAPQSYHCHHIRARNSYGNSAWTDWGCAVTPAANVGPSGYTYCAQEGQRCSFSGTKDVAYGANNRFNYKYGVSGGIDCNNSVFGDPLVGTTKACYIKDSSGGSSVNLARGKASWATSSDRNYPFQNGNDGNTGTRWSSGGSGAQWFKVDLGSAQRFNRFVVRWEAAYARTYYLAFCDNNCTSNDNSNWSGWQRTLSSRQDDTFDFGNQTHRYVGILMIDKAPGMGNFSFWEFEVYNRAGANSVESIEKEPQAPEPMKAGEPIQLPADPDASQP